MAKTKKGKAQFQRAAMTISEAIGVFERAFLTRNPYEIERYLREMLNVQVAVIENKEDAERALANGHRLKTVAVPFWVFRQKIGELLEGKREDEDPGVYQLEANRILDTGEREKVLSLVRSTEAILPGETFALLSEQAGYTPKKGLTFHGKGNPTGFEPLPEEEQREKFIEGKFQTWAEHIEGSWKCSKRLAELYRPFVKAWGRNVFAPQWEKKSDVEFEEFIDAIMWALRVAVLFHDIGKLDRKWQEIMWEREERIQESRKREEIFIARTSPVRDKATLKELKRPPSHAPFIYPFLRTFLRNLLGDYRFLDTIALAAARHHSLEVGGGMPKGKFDLEIKAKEFLKNWLPKIFEISDAEEQERLLDTLEKALQSVRSGSEADEPPSPSDDFYFLYCLTNRMVKLCDWEDAGDKVIELPKLKGREDASS